jgi:uncharacterized protein (DUF1800 family)
MNTPPTSPNLQRRSALQVLAAMTSMTSLGTWAQTGRGNNTAPSATNPAASPSTPLQRSTADAWRAMARIGYGPTAALVREVQAASSPKAWALAQVDAAYTASQQPPRIAPEMADFNAPLPQIFEGFARERMQRAQAKGKDTSKAVAKLAATDTNAAPDEERFSRTMVQQAATWRLMACSQPEVENPLLARMTEFWFNHFNVYAGKGPVRPFVGHYVVHVARAHALGQFEDLVLASARHPAMLAYLDQAQSVAEGTRGGANRKNHGLNENYARELMELHTLGVDGGYTQTDVRELARVLTGWTVGPQSDNGFRFVPRLHDTGTKQVLGRSFGGSNRSNDGVREGEEAIRMLARHPSTASRVCLRLAQFFVADNPPPALVERLRQNFLTTQGNLRSVLRTLLDAPELWDPANRLFKTPMDFACSALAVTHGATQDGNALTPHKRNLQLTAGFLSQAGQPLHGWQTPDGYAFNAATWLAPEALTRRADYALELARQAPEPAFLRPFLQASTLATADSERAALRAGLMLASPDFMNK